LSQEAVPQQDTAAGTSKRRLLSPAENPLVRAVGRVPAGVHAKLLVAFVGTALLVVVVGVLGLRLLGQSNERVETLGTLQVRAFGYGKLKSDAGSVRGLLSQRVGSDFDLVFPEQNNPDLEKGGVLLDAAILSAALQLPASTRPDQLGFRPPPEDERYLVGIRKTSDRLAAKLQEIVDVGLTEPEQADPLRVEAEGPRILCEEATHVHGRRQLAPDLPFESLEIGHADLRPLRDLA
jgi:hypothetical protein